MLNDFSRGVIQNNCFMGNCIANQKERKDTIEFLKNLQPGKFTAFTVLAAYEISGQVFSQLTKRKVDPKDPNYKVVQKILTEATRRNAGHIWPWKEAIAHMMYPEKPRIYIK